MRNFHTTTIVGDSMHAGKTSAIGRLHSACSYAHDVSLPDPINRFGERHLHQVSVHEMMSNNLQAGLAYKRKQFSGLQDFETIIREIIRSNSSPTAGFVTPTCNSKRLLFLQAIEALSLTKFRSFPLFGYGHESPMRLHLKINTKRIIRDFSPSPLLCKPAFRSIRLSLDLNQDVGSTICEESISEILSLMLIVRSEEENLQELSREVYSQSKKSALFYQPSRYQPQSFFKKLSSKFYSKLKLKSPRPLPELPV